jgi:hypothetical protein
MGHKRSGLRQHNGWSEAKFSGTVCMDLNRRA